ncbi:MAG TPA: hypothetical protein VL728_04340 [Cyclobacteriaceae bacterium]|nr:hypothetical protein [Cyclobacteriaceae bacterium]
MNMRKLISSLPRFMGIGTSDLVKSNVKSLVRETRFAEWKKARGIMSATLEFSARGIKK